jgi:hypothetical protein
MLPTIWLGFLLAGGMLLSGLGCKSRGIENNRDGRAEEWGNMSVRERDVFVEGYTAGQALGAMAACENADRLFRAEPPWFDKSGHPTLPTPRCIDSLDHYSRISLTIGLTRPTAPIPM